MKKTRILLGLVAILLVIMAKVGTAQNKLKTLSPPKYDENKWTEYIPGNMPLVISVPHGGNTIIQGLETNNCSGYNSHYDFGTIEIARAIQREFEEKYKLRPHIIICHLSRKHIDQNRDIEVATCGKEIMKAPWNKFHGFIDIALKDAVKNFGKAIYVDLHGHPHAEQRVELGYSINKKEITALKDQKVPATLAQKSSLRNFFTGAWNKDRSISDLLIGENSFGTLLVNNGIPAVPSTQVKAPLSNEPYFAAETVYNTPTYTSIKYPNVIGWQVECSIQQRKPAGHADMAQAFTLGMMTFIEKNTEIKVKR